MRGFDLSGHIVAVKMQHRY